LPCGAGYSGSGKVVSGFRGVTSCTPEAVSGFRGVTSSSPEPVSGFREAVQEGGRGLPGDLVAGPEGPVVVPGGDALVGQPGNLIGEHVAGRHIGELLAAGLVSLGPRIPVQEGGHRLTRDLVAGPEGPVVVPGGDALVGQPCDLLVEGVGSGEV